MTGPKLKALSRQTFVLSEWVTYKGKPFQIVGRSFACRDSCESYYDLKRPDGSILSNIPHSALYPSEEPCHAISA